MAKRRAPRTDEQLCVDSVHVHYELRMLRWLAVQLTTPPEEYEQRCAYMESFTIHARNLREFLWSADPRATDSIAQDFFVGPWSPPPEPCVLAEEGSMPWAVGKFIAHITHDRPAPGREKRWKVGPIAAALEESMETFRSDVTRLRPTALDPCWRARNARFRQLHETGRLSVAFSNTATSSSASVLPPNTTFPFQMSVTGGSTKGPGDDD